jgi:predicted nucleic acid-binding Zn ribbon protein
MPETISANEVRASAGLPPLRTLEEVRRERISLNTCVVCGQKAEMMCRKHTGICSENCQKLYTTMKEKQNAAQS